MSTVAASEYGSVLKTISVWPTEDKLALANEIIQSCGKSQGTRRPGVSPQELWAMLDSLPRVRPVEELIGLGAGNGSPPDDEEVARWVDEHRMGKHG